MDEQIESVIGSQNGETSTAALVGARRWSKLLGPPAAVTAGLSAITLGAIALLFRQLPEADAGTLALLLAYVEILSLVGLLGQNTVITRRYSRLDPQGFSWKDDLRTSAWMAVPIVLAGVLVAGILYDLDMTALAYIGFSSAVLVPTFVMIWMLNSHGRYVWSSVLLRLPNTLLAIPALLLLADPSIIQLDAILGLHVIAILGAAVLSFWLVRTTIRSGPVRISSAERRQGLYFLANQASLLMSFQGLIAVAGSLLSPARLAVYAAVAILFRTFKLMTNIMSMVIPPELIREEHPPYKRMFIGLLLIAAAGGLFTLLFGPLIIHTLYGGKYDDGKFLIFWMALSGMLLIMEVLPRSHIFGKLEWAKLRTFILVQTTVMVIVFLAAITLIVRYELLGVALATTLALLVRNLFENGYFAKLLTDA